MAKKKGVITEIAEKSDSFAVAFAVLFLITFGFLWLVGATPDGAASSSNNVATAQTPATTTTTASNVAETPSGAAQLPTRVVAKKIGLDVVVSNPDTTNVDTLDQYLLKGAVRYPTSAPLGVNGTVLIFGHSSYLPIVHNQNYKAFDGIQNLKQGDIVSVYSSDTQYQYSVTSVRVADANSDIIELPQDGQHLTLVTCDSFATKSNRFIVTADLVAATRDGVSLTVEQPVADAQSVQSAQTTQVYIPLQTQTGMPQVRQQTAAVAQALITPNYPPGTVLPQPSSQQFGAIVTLLIGGGILWWL